MLQITVICFRSSEHYGDKLLGANEKEGGGSQSPDHKLLVEGTLSFAAEGR